MCSLCGVLMAKNTILGNFCHLGDSCTDPFTNEGQIWCARADPRSTLTRQISCECVHCVGFLWPKITIFGQILTLRGSRTETLLPMRAKFVALEQTQGLHLQAKFHLNVFIISASGGQKPQFGANFDIFGGSCTDPLIPMRAKFGLL